MILVINQNRDRYSHDNFRTYIFFIRAVARAPYQVNQTGGGHHYPPKPETVPGQQLEQGQSSQRPAQPKPECDKDMLMEVKEDGQCSKDLELRL